MRRTPTWRRYLRFWGPDIDADVEDELRFHLEMREGDFRLRGLSPDAARRAAVERFGDIERVGGALREHDRRLGRIDGRREIVTDLVQDIRYGMRALRRAPGFTVVAVLTLALGIGATTAVFTLVKGVLLDPLPFAHQERLVTLAERDSAGATRLPSYPTFLDWRRQAKTLDLAYARGDRLPLAGPEGVENVVVAYVSPGFLSLLGAAPARGRGFLPEEEAPGRGEAVVLTHHFWLDHFGGDPAVLGRTLTIGDRSYAVVGVMPRGSKYPAWADLWIPVAAIAGTDRVLAERDFHADGVLIGRLHTGVSLARATAELGGIAHRLAMAYPRSNGHWPSAEAAPLADQILGDVRPRLLMLMGAVALVLLIACANVTNLSLARASARTREIAIRSALGARRGRVVRQLLTESALVAACGGALGLAAGAVGVRLLQRAAPAALPRLSEVALDGRVVLFAAGISLATALLVGLAPALRVAAPDLVDALKEGATAAGRGRSHRRLRAVLVTAEIAVALMLVAGAGLLIRSFWQLQRVNPGFDPEGLVSLTVTPPLPKYEDPARVAALYASLPDAVRSIPGVREVALSNFLPLTGAGIFAGIQGTDASSDAASAPGAVFHTISPNYFRTMGIPLRSGRAFTEADLSGVATVAIVNDAFVRVYLARGNAVGRSVTTFRSAQGRADFGQPMPLTVVGVVGDVRFFGLAADPPPQIYLPYTANPWTHMDVVVRATADPASLMPAIRRAVRGVEPDIPLPRSGASSGSGTMNEVIASGLGARRFNSSLLTIFAAAALLLATIGIYGLMAYSVAQRTREIGLRMALGAGERDVLRMLVGQGMLLSAIGIVLGLAGSLLGSRLLTSLLYGVTSTDPLTLGTVALLLGAVALLACWLPARRAMRVDPVQALRAD